MNLVTGYKLNIEKYTADMDLYPQRHLYSIVEARYIKRGGITDNPDVCALPKPATRRTGVLNLVQIPVSSVLLPGRIVRATGRSASSRLDRYRVSAEGADTVIILYITYCWVQS